MNVPLDNNNSAVTVEKFRSCADAVHSVRVSPDPESCRHHGAKAEKSSCACECDCECDCELHTQVIPCLPSLSLAFVCRAIGLGPLPTALRHNDPRDMEHCIRSKETKALDGGQKSGAGGRANAKNECKE